MGGSSGRAGQGRAGRRPPCGREQVCGMQGQALAGARQWAKQIAKAEWAWEPGIHSCHPAMPEHTPHIPHDQPHGGRLAAHQQQLPS